MFVVSGLTKILSICL